MSALYEVQQYAFNVLMGEIPACKYVKLACQRFLNDLKRDDIWFDKKAAQKFFTYSTYMCHYKGPMRGKPIVLDPWEKFFFGQLYGWKQVIDDEQTDLWRFHYAYLEVPRKNGKTTIAAVAASYDCEYVEETGAEVYCLATKEDQAKILYGDITAYIHQSEDLKELFEILLGRNTIYSRKSGRTSFIKPLGSNSERLDGLNPLSAICDELHEWPDRKLLDVIEDAFGARTNWHILEITTAGYNKQGVCYTERKHSIDILEGRVIKDDKLAIIYTVDDEDKDNWRDEAVWFKANPSLGVGKQLAYMKSKAEKADQIPSELTTFLNKQLGIWTDVLESWLKYDTWVSCQRKYDRKDLLGKKCTVAVDLAKVRDLSAVAYFFPVQDGLDVPHVLVDFYCPEESVKNRSEREKLPYDVWVREGWVIQTQGNTTDFAFIEADIIKNAEAFDVKEIAFDRFMAGEIINNLTDEGLEIVDFGMGFISMGPPTSELERLLSSKGIAHNGNPVLNWMSSNVVTRKDPAGNIKPDKEASSEKIDGIVAVIMALGRTMATREPEKKSVYETRGLRTV